MTSTHYQLIGLALSGWIISLMLVGSVQAQESWQKLPETYLADELRENMQCFDHPEPGKQGGCAYEIPNLRFAVYLETASFEIDEVSGNYSIRNYWLPATPDGMSIKWTRLIDCLKIQFHRQSPDDDMDFQILTAYVHLETGDVLSSGESCN